MDIIWKDDISIKDGDFELGNNDETKAVDIITAGKGNFFWNPLLGYDIKSKINSNTDFLEEKGKIISELKKEKLSVNFFEIDGININLSIE